MALVIFRGHPEDPGYPARPRLGLFGLIEVFDIRPLAGWTEPVPHGKHLFVFLERGSEISGDSGSQFRFQIFPAKLFLAEGVGFEPTTPVNPR